MAEKASKAMIVSWCLMIALCIFSGALCLYFFVFDRPANEHGGSMYVRMSEILTSSSQIDTDLSLGDLDSGKCNDYASNYLIKHDDVAKQAVGKRFKSAFMCYFIDQEIIDTYKDEIVYLGNADIKSYVRLENALDDYEKALANLKLYLDKFIVSYNANVASESTFKDFEYMLSDFEKLKDSTHVVACVVFNYVSDYYYGKSGAVNKFASAKYVFTYALNLQSSTAYRLYIVKEKTTEKQYFLYETETYWDTFTQINKYLQVKEDRFVAQSNNANVINMMVLMAANQDAYADFFQFNCKRLYYANIDASTTSGANQKSAILIIAKGIGLEGRLA
ncbi:MAG: hypothetical protein IKQ31_00430 [Clostridia bacterium]|nr:hypothetical protein [Clostridia bacterium]